MPLDSGSRVGTSVNKSPQPSDSQSSPVQDASDSSARHKSRFIRILQNVGSYLANKFYAIKNFFHEGSKARDITKTGSSKYYSPDTGEAFPSYKSNSNKKKVETAPPQESKSIEIIQEIREKPKKSAQPLDTQDNSEEILDLNLPPIDTSDKTDSKGETVADRQQQGVTPPIMPDSHPSAHKKTKYVYVEAQEETKEKVGMDAFEEKMNKRGFNKDEYDSKRPWPSEVKNEPVKVEKKSLFSMFLSFFGIGNTSTKTSRVQATQSTNQHQSHVVNSIKEAQEGIISGLPSYNKAIKDIDKQERVLAQWIPYIFPRYLDDATKIAGKEYGFTSIADVIKFSKDATLFTRLIKCSLNITRDTINGESKAIYSILDTENCKYFRDSMQTFLNFVQSKDCKNKEILDDIVQNVARKDCIKFFKDVIEKL